MLKKICICILGYALFFLSDTTIFSTLLFGYRCDMGLSFESFWYYQLIGQEVAISENIATIIICFVQKILDVSSSAVLTGFIFAYILNWQPQIIFPEKLVIRHRTSWEAKNKLTMGILIGNKSYCNIHNAECVITCAYIKQEEPLLINSEFTLREERYLLENFYRFSFDLSKFPKQLLKDIIERPSYYERDTITVSVSGSCNQIGNSFKITKNYKLSDIVYDEHTPIIGYARKNIFTGKDLVNPFTGKKIKRFQWDELKEPVEVSEEKRFETIKEIKYIIKNKKRVK